jgi:hypothetical protein
MLWYNNPEAVQVQDDLVRERTRRTHGLRLVPRHRSA